jgi:hypothetical protein
LWRWLSRRRRRPARPRPLDRLTSLDDGETEIGSRRYRIPNAGLGYDEQHVYFRMPGLRGDNIRGCRNKFPQSTSFVDVQCHSARVCHSDPLSSWLHSRKVGPQEVDRVDGFKLRREQPCGYLALRSGDLCNGFHVHEQPPFCIHEALREIKHAALADRIEKFGQANTILAYWLPSRPSGAPGCTGG